MLGLLALLAGLAPGLAREPLPELRPMAAPADLASRYRQQAQQNGVAGEKAELVCRLLAERLSVCFVKGATGELDYVSRADLAAWGLDPAAVEARATEAALAGFTAGRPAAASVDGVAGRYWVSAEADGLDAAGLLHPARLDALAGVPVVVAVPVQGALLCWVPGDAELDKVMAVAVRRMYDASPQRVSPLLYRWKEGRWAVWGEAVKAGELDLRGR